MKLQQPGWQQGLNKPPWDTGTSFCYNFNTNDFCSVATMDACVFKWSGISHSLQGSFEHLLIRLGMEGGQVPNQQELQVISTLFGSLNTELGA